MFSANTSQVSNDVKYIEDFFSAWLRTGTGSSQTVTTGIKENTGALVISKSRSAATDWAWYDTFRGATKDIASNTTAAETTQSQGLTSFNTDGHTWGTLAKVNTSGATYVDFVLKPTPKFFDVVTYTGNGVAGRTVAHNLGSVPGCIIIKQLNDVTNWITYHRANTANPETDYLQLNSTAATIDLDNVWNDTAPTSTEFTLGINNDVNKNGGTYVAYLFAHNAGGFGLTGTDNVISCGSYTGNGSATGPVVTLGYEPQWLLIKRATGGTSNWSLIDNMRGFTVAGIDDAELNPNLSAAEGTGNLVAPNATGFQLTNAAYNVSGSDYIYIAIRRGPMKTPTSGTSVLGLRARTGTGVNATVTNGSGVTDLAIVKNRGSAVNWLWSSRMTSTGYLSSNDTTVGEVAAGTTILQANPWDVMNGIKVGTTSTITNASSNTFINYLLSRAPGFMDVCCYTGTGTARTVNHNLGVAPEMMIVKKRNSATNSNWVVYCGNLLTPITNNAARNFLLLNTTQAGTQSDVHWDQTAPTSSVFTVGASTNTNSSADTFVAYLFATCPGVSKVGSYVGNGTNQIINCGFTAGARFILIKGIDVEARDWYLWDSARGIVVGNDSILNPNTSAAQTTGFDDVEADSTGFKVLQGGAQVNTSGYNYIFLAIA